LRELGVGTKLAFGFGQAAEGIKNAAYSVFLFFFYTQVLGLSGTLAGAAIFIALVFDAVTDPLAGSLSDSLHHRWGRRHPFMYASALPLALCFAASFSPPSGLGQWGLFAWLCLFAVLTRGAMTLFHVPHLALGAELSQEYDERTVVVAYRTFFGFLGAALLIFVGFGVFLRGREELDFGQLNPSGYSGVGLWFGAAMAAIILVSAAGTHHRIPFLPRPAPGREPFSGRRLARELGEAIANRSFRVFFVGLVFFFIARGVELVLGQHMGTYFWGLRSEQFRLIPLAGIFGVMIGTPICAALARRVDKRQMYVVGLLWFSSITMALPLLKMGELFPSEMSPLYLPLLVGAAFVAALGGAAGLLAAGSMLADIADEHELENGRRQEGIFFGALSFSGKASAGVGSLIAGVGLDLIEFPAQAAPGTVPESKLDALGLLYGSGIFAAALVAAVPLFRYRIDRERHAEIRAELDRRRLAAAAADLRRPATQRAVASGAGAE
jgi:Na+/melibiose symporter-like transporter